MKTKSRKGSLRWLLLILLLAVPFAAAGFWAWSRWGLRAEQLFQLALKAMVIL